MEIQPGYSQIPQPDLMDRRDFLRRTSLLGIASAAAAVLSGGTQAAKAAELGLNALASLADRPWTSPRWWPIFQETADHYGLPTLIDVGGPLHEHDVQAWNKFGYVTHALEEGINWFDYVRNNHKDMQSWAGYCPPLAAAGIFEPEPQAGRFNKATKEGLLVAKHAGDPMVPISRDVSMPALLGRGRWVAVNAPTPGVSGVWMRAAYAFNGSTIGVTAWGAGHIEIPVSHVVQAFSPVNDPEGLIEEDESIQSTGAWRIKNLRMDVIDYIVSQ